MSKVLGKHAEEIAEQVELWIDGYIENLINNDYNKKRKLISLLKTYNIKKSDSKKLYESFNGVKDELAEVIKNEDPELMEGYDFLTPTKLKKLYVFVSEICDDLKLHSTITKKKRKRSPDSIVKNLKFAKDATVGKYKIESFDPRKILDCKSFMVYNIKTSDVSYYQTDSSFDVKGTTIKNFNEDKSFTKKIGRNADVLVYSFISGGHATVFNELVRVKTKARKCTGRINQSTILLRILT